MKKPATGWLHDDTALSRGDGVYYPVKVSAPAGGPRCPRRPEMPEGGSVWGEASPAVGCLAGSRNAGPRHGVAGGEGGGGRCRVG